MNEDQPHYFTPSKEYFEQRKKEIEQRKKELIDFKAHVVNEVIDMIELMRKSYDGNNSNNTNAS